MTLDVASAMWLEMDHFKCRCNDLIICLLTVLKSFGGRQLDQSMSSFFNPIHLSVILTLSACFYVMSMYDPRSEIQNFRDRPPQE